MTAFYIAISFVMVAVTFADRLKLKICTSAKPPTLARQPRLLSELALPIRQLASAASGSVLIPRLLCKVEANSILIWPRNNFAFDPLDGLWPTF